MTTDDDPEAVALAALDLAIGARQIVNVALEDDGGSTIHGWRMRLRCGHEVWSPIPPLWRPIPCMECLNVAIDAVRAARALRVARRLHADGATHECSEWVRDHVCQVCGGTA